MHQAINNFLISIPAGTRSIVWYVFIILLVLITCTLISIHEWRLYHSVRKSVMCFCLSLSSFGVVILTATFVETLTNDVVLLSGVTYYIPYLFCASFLLSKYQRRDFWETADMVSLCYLPARAVNIIGCTVSGCCQGIPAEWGLYSAVLRENVIPVQLFESIGIFAIWFILLQVYKHDKCKQKGICSIYSMIFFGGLNVVTDIFTYIQPKLVYMVSVEGIFAFITMSTGLILLYMMGKKQRQSQ